MVGSLISQGNTKRLRMKYLNLKISILILFLVLGVVPANVFSAVLDWDAVANTWAPTGSLTQTYNIGGSNIIITFSDPDSGLDTGGSPGAPETSIFQTGGTGETTLFIRTNFADVFNDQIVVTIDFTHPGGVSDVNFSLFDMDATSPQWIDDAVITATDGTNTFNPSLITPGIANQVIGTNTVRGTAASGNTSANGNAAITFNQTGITQISIVYSNATATSQPPTHNQWISIHDISFDVAPTVTKSFSPGIMTAGDVSTLTLNLGNNDTSVATLTAHMQDNLPAGVTIANPANIAGTCPGTITAPVGGSTVTYSSGSTIPAGGCTIIVDVTSSSVGTVTNTIAANALQTDLGNNAAAANDDLTISAAVAPTVNKSFSPGSIGLNATSTLTITLDNANTYAATLSAALIDTLPTVGNGDVVVAATPNIGGTCNNADITAVAGATTISYANNASIPVGGCTIIADVTSATAGNYTNTITAGALQTNFGNNAAAALDNLTVNSTTPPTVAKSFNPNSITTGGNSQLTISLGNISASAITLLANLDDNLPTGVTATSVDTGATSCTDTSVDISTNTRVRYIIGATIPSGGCVIVVNVTSNTLGTVTNTIIAGALQTDVGSNVSSASDNLTVNAGGGSASCPSGQTLSTATPNPSYASAQTNAGVSNPNNALSTYSTAGAGASNANSANLRANDILRLEFVDTLAQNSSVILSLARDNNNGRVNLAFSDDGINEDAQVGTFGNGGTLGAGAVDVLTHLALSVPGDGYRYLIIRRLNGRNWVDGASYDQICVASQTADLSITKDDSSLTYSPGGTATYTIIVSNAGPDSAIGATVVDVLPNGVTVDGNWTCTPESPPNTASCVSGASAGTTATGSGDINQLVDIPANTSVTFSVPVLFSSDMNDY